MNINQVNFECVYTIEDDALVSMFKSLETCGLRTFLGLLVIIYEDTLLEFYSKAIAFAAKQV